MMWRRETSPRGQRRKHGRRRDRSPGLGYPSKGGLMNRKTRNLGTAFFPAALGLIVVTSLLALSVPREPVFILGILSTLGTWLIGAWEVYLFEHEVESVQKPVRACTWFLLVLFGIELGSVIPAAVLLYLFAGRFESWAINVTGIVLGYVVYRGLVLAATVTIDLPLSGRMRYDYREALEVSRRAIPSGEKGPEWGGIRIAKEDEKKNFILLGRHRVGKSKLMELLM